MKLEKHDLLAALRLRYDHYSAQSILEAALERAGLPVQDDYDVKQVAAFRTALAKVGDRLANVDARLDSLLEAAPAASTPPADKPTGKPAPKPVEPAAAVEKPKPDPVDKAAAAAAEKSKTDAADKAAAKLVETQIVLAGVPVKDGEQILLCGGGALLGDWNPEKAPTMKRDGDTWLATIKIPADTEAVPFKFLRRAADGTVTWESGDDRKLVAKPRIEATWR